MGPLVGLEGVEHSGETGAATISLRFEEAIMIGPLRLSPRRPHKIAGLLLNDVRPVAGEGLSAAIPSASGGLAI